MTVFILSTLADAERRVHKAIAHLEEFANGGAPGEISRAVLDLVVAKNDLAFATRQLQQEAEHRAEVEDGLRRAGLERVWREKKEIA